MIPAETEELSYKWRNVRLAEKGFLPFEKSDTIAFLECVRERIIPIFGLFFKNLF